MNYRISLKTAALSLVWIFLMNAVFYGMHYLSILVPADLVKTRTREAFQSQNLVPENYPKLKYGLSSNYALIGLDQFTDGLVIQMAMYRHPSKIRAAFLPKMAMPDVQDTTLLKNQFPCETARFIATGQAAVSESKSYYYHRYWWGQKVVLLLMLTVFDYFQINNLLKALIYFSFAVLGFLILLYDPKWFWPLFPILLSGALFSGTIYYGGLTDSTTFLSSQLFLIAFLAFQHRMRDERRLAPLFTVLGCMAAFMYSMRGGLMLFCSVAFLVLYFITFGNRKPVDRYVGAFLCLTFFFAGFFGSFVIRQAVSALLLDWKSVLHDFLFQLKFRIGAGRSDFDKSIIPLFKREFFNYVYATYNSRWLSDLLIGSGILAWTAAAGLFGFLAFRKREVKIAFDFAAVCFAVLIVFARIVIMRNHSYVHAWFIGRYMFLPLSFGWTALILAFKKWKG